MGKNTIKSGRELSVLPGIFKYILLYTIGGIGYGSIEMIFRGKTHWSMLLAGGMCFCALNKISEMPIKKSWKKWLLGSAAITSIEFVSGVIVNIWLRWNVWNYSQHVFNLFGQICPLFSCIWFLISIPAIAFCGVMKNIRGKGLLLPRLQRGGLCQDDPHQV